MEETRDQGPPEPADAEAAVDGVSPPPRAHEVGDKPEFDRWEAVTHPGPAFEGDQAEDFVEAYMGAGERLAEWHQQQTPDNIAALRAEYGDDRFDSMLEGHFAWGADRDDPGGKPLPLPRDVYPDHATFDSTDPVATNRGYPEFPHGHKLAEPYREFVGDARIDAERERGEAGLIETAYGNDRGTVMFQEDTAEARAARDAALDGLPLGRVSGSLPGAVAGEYWSTLHPSEPDYASRNGIAETRLRDDFQVEGTIPPGTPDVTAGHPVPEPGTRADAIEVTTPDITITSDAVYKPPER